MLETHSARGAHPNRAGLPAAPLLRPVPAAQRTRLLRWDLFSTLLPLESFLFPGAQGEERVWGTA